ncbi:MAG: hypothetical protein EXX96DRAFT_592968 [Benjaminiella poitrasii]|nr:MAG: hypothetical protein EXX96DRAFT_592968 [Benjaminiella poitrasii]
MQRLLPSVAPSPKERSEIYKLCLANIDDARQWLSDWFMLASSPSEHPSFTDIGRDNVAEWLSWAFFSSPLEDVLEDDVQRQELDYMINHFQETFDLRFEPGYNENLIACRLNLDPVHAYHRPLAFYTLVLFLSTLFGAFCYLWGFRKFGPESRSAFWNVDAPTLDDHQKVSYWFRDGDRSKTPVVFIHGIGAGLMCYVSFLRRLMELDAPLIWVELPYVSMHCVEQVPTMQETVKDLQAILARHGFDEAVFVAHSLGTAVVSWTALFISPLTPPTDTTTAMTTYPSAATVRLPKQTKVYLSEKDNIVDSKRVDRYLHCQGLDAVTMQGLDHASFLFYPRWQNDILETIRQFIQP